MIMNRIVKWAAASVLAVGTLPAIGFARTRASLPSAVSVTPVGMTAPVAKKHTVKRIAKHTTRRATAKSAHRKAAVHRKVATKRRAAARHAPARKKSVAHKSARARHHAGHRPTKHA